MGVQHGDVQQGQEYQKASYVPGFRPVNCASATGCSSLDRFDPSPVPAFKISALWHAAWKLTRSIPAQAYHFRPAIDHHVLYGEYPVLIAHLSGLHIAQY
jgi:hypothetical protein